MDVLFINKSQLFLLLWRSLTLGSQASYTTGYHNPMVSLCHIGSGLSQGVVREQRTALPSMGWRICGFGGG
jgi:hypothetical protein